MKPAVFRIIALEPEPERGRRLKELVREKVDAEVIVVPSWDAAAAAMSARVPDVILTSTLLPPGEEAKLLLHLRELATGSDPAVLFVPPVVEDQRSSPDRGLRSPLAAWRTRGPAHWPPYDVDAIGSRITEALKQSQSSRRRMRLVNGGGKNETPTSPVLVTPDSATSVGVRRARSHRAHRWTPSELPWACTIHTRWGIDARVVNLSRSGILIESMSKVAPESSIELRVRGPQTLLDVPVRVVRCEVSVVDVRGVKYRAAGIFDSGLDLLSEEAGSEPDASESAPSPLSASQAVIYGSMSRSQNAW